MEKNNTKEPIRVAQIVGKYIGGGVEAVVVLTRMETLSRNLFKPFKIKELQFS